MVESPRIRGDRDGTSEGVHPGTQHTGTLGRVLSSHLVNIETPLRPLQSMRLRAVAGAPMSLRAFSRDFSPCASPKTGNSSSTRRLDF